LRTQIIALAAGFFGIMFASYENQILGQNHTGVVMCMSMVYFFAYRNWVDKDGNILPEQDIDK
jgi:drug/metabolite transporter (DMT)-like permease